MEIFEVRDAPPSRTALGLKSAESQFLSCPKPGLPFAAIGFPIADSSVSFEKMIDDLSLRHDITPGGSASDTPFKSPDIHTQAQNSLPHKDSPPSFNP